MYKLSRLLLVLGVLAGAYAFAIIAVIGWPASGWLFAISVVATAARKRFRHLTTLGSARWATASDLCRAGMVDASTGLIVGRTAAIRHNRFTAALQKLFAWRLRAAESCKQFWGSLYDGKPPVVRLPHAVHTAVFSPTGGGKGVSCVVPFLLTCPDSCVVIDFKGENERLTAEHRRKSFGHRIIRLDPFKISTRTPDSLNPVAFIDGDDSCAIDECNDLAKALVVRSDDEREPHWNDSAEQWIAGLVATVARYGDVDEGTRSLQTVRDIVSDPQKLDWAIKLMGESDAWGGLLNRMGGQLQHFIEKEKASVLTTVGRHLRFLDTPAVRESTSCSTFDPASLLKGGVTVYLILTPDHMRSQSALLRMWIGSLMRGVIRGGLDRRRKIHFILDEAASLGHMDVIDDAVDKYRGYGIRLQFYFQSLGQLKKCFPGGQDQTLLSNVTSVFFGVNDNATADYVSAHLGDETIVVDSGNTSRGTSYQTTQAMHPSTSWSRSENVTESWQQQARRLLKSEEVMALSPREAITFAPGVRPIRTTLLRYYEEPGLGRRRGWLARFGTATLVLGLSTALWATLFWFAGVLSTATQHRQWAPSYGIDHPKATRTTGIHSSQLRKGVR
ncbi:MAG: type IV secretory system conjugative DNA transfer family protein [Planctomycetes bacterium]|nr:type IV secretory system conjugative DNA transfer family protein [Planctomycetota bacterium]